MIVYASASQMWARVEVTASRLLPGFQPDLEMRRGGEPASVPLLRLSKMSQSEV